MMSDINVPKIPAKKISQCLDLKEDFTIDTPKPYIVFVLISTLLIIFLMNSLIINPLNKHHKD